MNDENIVEIFNEEVIVVILSFTTAAHGVTNFVAMVVAPLWATFTLGLTGSVATEAPLTQLSDIEVDAMRKTGLGQGTAVDSGRSGRCESIHRLLRMASATRLSHAKYAPAMLCSLRRCIA